MRPVNPFQIVGEIDEEDGFAVVEGPWTRRPLRPKGEIFTVERPRTVIKKQRGAGKLRRGSNRRPAIGRAASNYRRQTRQTDDDEQDA